MIPIPVDPALPSLPVLLDVEAMADVLARSLSPEAIIADLQIETVRYRPSRRLAVGYRMLVSGADLRASAMVSTKKDLQARVAVSPQMIRRVGKGTGVERLLRYDPAVDAIVQWVPLDISIPALAGGWDLLRPPEHWGLSTASEASDPVIARYKPFHGAVLRLGDCVAKAYAHKPRFQAAVAGWEAAAGSGAVRTPALLGARGDLQVLWLSAVDGPVFGDPLEHAIVAGALLRELHAVPARGLSQWSPSSYRGPVGVAARLVTALVPSLKDRVERLLRAIEDSQPDCAEMVVCHGDYLVSQIVDSPEGPTLIDLDSVSLGPPARDFANYASWTRGDVELVHGALAGLAEGYGNSPEALLWHVATARFLRAPHSFRKLDERWPDRVEALVAEAEALLIGCRCRGVDVRGRRSNNARPD